MYVDARMEEKEASTVDGDYVDEPPNRDGKEEESKERLDLPDEEPIKWLLEEPPIKRRPAWCR
jgi:plasmid replication initiation protein